VFLSLLKQNKLQRELYFTIGFPEDAKLSLNDYFTSLIIVDKLNTSNEKALSDNAYKKELIKILQLSKWINTNSSDELKFVDNFRYLAFLKIYDYMSHNDLTKAKEILNILAIYCDENKFPFQYQEGKEYYDYLKEELK
jgi:hypothetical protein